MTIVATKCLPVQEVQLRDAKARLCAVVDAAEQGEGAIITRHGKPAAVIISYEERRRLSNIPSFGALLAQSPLEDGDLPECEPWAPRDLDS